MIGLKNYQIYQRYRVAIIFALILIMVASGIIWSWQQGLLNSAKQASTLEISTLEKIRADNEQLREKLQELETQIKQLEKKQPSNANIAGVATQKSNPNNAILSSNNNQLINLNTAAQSQLESLPGIGPSKARAIMDYRSQEPFKQKSDLKKVKGIGDKIYRDLETLITID